MRLREFGLLVLLAIAVPVSARAQGGGRPSIVIPIGIGSHTGIGTWGARIGVIVGRQAKQEDGADGTMGLLVLGEAATDQFRALGVGIGGSYGLPLGPVHVLSGAGFRLTLNSAAWNPDLSGYRRRALGVSAGFTYPILSYSMSLYRELEDQQRAGGWQWRLGLGLGF